LGIKAAELPGHRALALATDGGEQPFDTFDLFDILMADKLTANKLMTAWNLLRNTSIFKLFTTDKSAVKNVDGGKIHFNPQSVIILSICEALRASDLSPGSRALALAVAGQ
jgi:hypothetical protein